MRKRNRVAATITPAIAVVSGSLVIASPASAASPCGFYPITTGNLGGGDDGYYEMGTYNNCKSDNALITVSYTYASESACVTPGETPLFANPNLGALTGARWTGSYC